MNKLSLGFEQLENDHYVVNFDSVDASDAVHTGGYISLRTEDGVLVLELFDKKGNIQGTTLPLPLHMFID